MYLFCYTVFGKDMFDMRGALGFTGGNFSTDVEYVVGDRGLTTPCEECGPLVRPSYVPDDMFPNWPQLSHSEAAILIVFPASFKGASDGWSFREDENK